MGRDLTDDKEYVASGWDDGSRAFKEDGGGGKWLKLNDGEAAKVVFVGQPQIYKKSWKAGDPPKTRAEIDVYMIDDGDLKTWDMSGAVFDQVKNDREMRPETDLPFAVYGIRRNGTGMDTRYTISYLRQADERERAGIYSYIPGYAAATVAASGDIPL